MNGNIKWSEIIILLIIVAALEIVVLIGQETLSGMLGVILIFSPIYLIIILGKRADKYLKEKELQQSPYQAKRIMTIHEQNFYKYLKPVADELGLILLCQVTLSEIIQVPKGTVNYLNWFYKISSKHIDFVLCDSVFFPVLAIELDDSSHDKPKRKERDQQVNTFLQRAGIKIIHFRNWTPNQIRKDITEIIKPPIAV